jgi:hypothetical protein
MINDGIEMLDKARQTYFAMVGGGVIRTETAVA